MDFSVELYDVSTKKRLPGDNTICTVTILDEDFPGTLSFKVTEVVVSKNAKKAEIVINRTNGCDGEISCMVKTLDLNENNNFGQNAVQFDDYLPMYEKINFEHGETEKIVKIQLMTDNEDKINETQDKGKEDGDDIEEASEKDEAADLMFKVLLLNPSPEGVRISKKNICIVRISQEDQSNVEDENEKLLQYFLQVREPTWGQQFKNAVMLGPQLDQDNLIIDGVSLGEALLHFATIGWKFVFSIVPPVKLYGGGPAFGIALCFIGLMTAIVEQFAKLFGCCIGIPEAICAITIVALGTSLPDTFASKTAATTSKFADSAIGNITGSNSVNVFLGLGLPWVIASYYWQSIDGRF